MKKILKKLKINKKEKELTDDDYFKINSFTTKKKGKKEYDYLIIVDYAVDQNIFKYPNLKEWDYDNWKFQFEAGTMVQEEYKNLYLSETWFRAIPYSEFSNKREFIYGSLVSAQEYILDKVYERLEELIDNIFPKILVKPYGEKTFKKIKGSKYMTMVDFSERCAGKETERKNLDAKFRELYPEIKSYINKLLMDYEGMTFLVHGEKKHDVDHYIIGGIKAASEINPKTFFYDFYSKQQPEKILLNIEKIVYDKFQKSINFHAKKIEKEQKFKDDAN